MMEVALCIDSLHVPSNQERLSAVYTWDKSMFGPSTGYPAGEHSGAPGGAGASGEIESRLPHEWSWAESRTEGQGNLLM